jgi:hypothetical protein
VVGTVGGFLTDWALRPCTKAAHKSASSLSGDRLAQPADQVGHILLGEVLRDVKGSLRQTAAVMSIPDEHVFTPPKRVARLGAINTPGFLSWRLACAEVISSEQITARFGRQSPPSKAKAEANASPEGSPIRERQVRKVIAHSSLQRCLGTRSLRFELRPLSCGERPALALCRRGRVPDHRQTRWPPTHRREPDDAQCVSHE